MRQNTEAAYFDRQNCRNIQCGLGYIAAHCVADGLLLASAAVTPLGVTGADDR